MTPKEKAKELVDKMYQHQWRKDTVEFRNAKQCALITVEEVINGNFGDGYDHQFWECVKTELEVLR